MRSLSALLLLLTVVGCDRKTTASENEFLLAAAEAGCSVLNPCGFSVDTDLAAIRFHATPRWDGTKSTETFKSVGVDSHSLLLTEGARIGCDGKVECEFTMVRGEYPNVFFLINEIDREDEGTLFNLRHNALTIEN